jgi:hypothetical protein
LRLIRRYSFALPAVLAVEGLDQHQKAVLAGIQMPGQFGDLLAQAGQFLSLGEDVLHCDSPQAAARAASGGF